MDSRKRRLERMAPLTVLLLPQLAWASDYSGLLPLYIAFVAVIGGVVAGLEWVLINAIMDRGEDASEGDREAQNKSRFGCGLGIILWVVNSFVAHLVIMKVWV
jgi:hypothetical protein